METKRALSGYTKSHESELKPTVDPLVQLQNTSWQLVDYWILNYKKHLMPDIFVRFQSTSV